MNRTFLRACTLVGLSLAMLSCRDQPTQPTSEVRPQALIPAGGTGYDLNSPPGSGYLLVNGARWYFPVPFKVGTGLINPFLSIQNSPSEEGFNTDASPLPLNDTRSSFTNALPLNLVPVIKRDGVLWREIILDANEANSAPDAYFSIDFFDLFVCLDVAGTTIPTVSTVAGFASNSSCVKVYNFTPGNTGFATDGLSSGSGNTLDYEILIPENAFDAFHVGAVTLASCPYNPLASPCGLWLVLHTNMGGFGGDWVTGSTFEEFSTIKQPFVTVSKTATPAFTRTYTWDIAKSVNPDAITLFAGQSKDAAYTVTVTQTGHTDSGWQVTGAVTINNPAPATGKSSVPDTITAVTDLLEPGDIPVALNCGVTFPYVLVGGGTLTCSYTKTFASDPGSGTFTNTVSVESSGLAVNTAMSDPFSFTTPTAEVNKTVDVTDLFNANLTQLANDISAGQTFNYSHTFTCDADEGGHLNTASVLGDGGAVLDTAKANVTVNCLDVQVTKDAKTALQRTYKWLIDKSVTPATWDLFTNDDGTSAYTVTVTPNGFDDAQWTVTGAIHVHNPNTLPVYLQSVGDAISGPLTATVDCGAISFPYTLAAGATLDCTYSSALPDGTDRTNTATVSAKPTPTGTAKDFTGTAAVSFAGVVLTEVNKTVHVTDTFKGALGTADFGASPTTFTYSRKFTCDADKGKHDNTASITETGQSDDASVTVNCYKLAVTKDATTSFKRNWSWTIDKTGDQSELTLAASESFIVNYSVKVDGTSVDSAWGVTGNIAVKNLDAPMAATINSVADVVSGAGAATVSCGVTFPYSLAAGGTLNCTYSKALPDTARRTNTATATQQNYSYDKNKSGTASVTTDYSKDAAVAFGAPIETDECINVTDTYAGALGTVCGSDPLPKTFTYSRTVGPFGVCGEYTVDNTSAFVTNDTGATGSDSWTVLVHVPCVGCTLTPGYWKTHNASFKAGYPGKGPAPDTIWKYITPNKELTGFFTTDAGNSFPTTGPNAPPFTWFTVFWTNPAGNAYYNLSFQYMAAKLNVFAGAGSAVDAQIAAAEALFAQYTPAQIDALQGNDPLRMQFITLAGQLGAFNSGKTGPGHCDEDATASLTLR